MANLPDVSRYSAIREALRRATHDIHIRLNHHPLLAGMTQPGYSLRTYQYVLLGYFHFYRTLEAALESAIYSYHLDFDYTTRRKHPWIAADLAYFGLDPMVSDFLPGRPLGPFATLNAGQTVGTLYAIEGSTLGGQVITRYLAKNLELTPDTGARFFTGYAAQTAEHWITFEHFMNTRCLDTATQEQACQGARATFLLIVELLDDYYTKLPNYR